VKKKFFASARDAQDWLNFTKNLENVYDKETNFYQTNAKIKKLDLHGFSLDEANKKAEKFIIESYKYGYKKILIITGKGSRSKVYDDPYRSEKMSVLKYSVPEYIKNQDNLSKKIKSITKADINDGGDGAIYVNLKQQ
jgi:DNA-nicking Smr family endonuclease